MHKVLPLPGCLVNNLPNSFLHLNANVFPFPLNPCSNDVSTQSTIPPQPLSFLLVQGPLPAQTTSSIKSSQNYPIAQGPLPIHTMSKIGPVEGLSDPFIPSVAVQGPLPVHYTSTAISAPGPSLVQPALHVGSAEDSLPVCNFLSKDIAQRVSPARCASFVGQQQDPIPRQSCVFTSFIQGSHGQSKTTYSSQVQSTCFFPTEHPTQSAGYIAPYKPHTIYLPQALSYVKQPQRFQPNFPRYDQQLDLVQPPTYSRPAQNQPPHSFVPPVNNSLQNPLLQLLYYPDAYNPDSVKYDDLFIPRPELPKFSKDPLDFKGFINNFETHIEPRVQNEKTLFCLLLQHCSKVVKDCIEHFATIDEHPYTTAKQRLNKEYGTPWIISDVCEQRLKVFPVIKSDDGEKLRRFAKLLEKTQIIVKDIRHYTRLDSLDTLTDLAAKLPYDLKKRWVRKAVQIENSFGHLANFSHFVEFVVKESEEVNSLFGLRSLRPKSASFKSSNKTKSSFATVATKSTYNATATYKPSSKDNSSNKSTSNSVSKFFGQSRYCWFCKNTSHTLFD